MDCDGQDHAYSVYYDVAPSNYPCHHTYGYCPPGNTCQVFGAGPSYPKYGTCQ